jgi:hypothetical protein
MDKREPSSDGGAPQFAGHLGNWEATPRREYARRLLVRGALFAPLILASVLTTKSVAATKIIVTSIPLSL